MFEIGVLETQFCVYPKHSFSFRLRRLEKSETLPDRASARRL